jgi:hypothetical protein
VKSTDIGEKAMTKTEMIQTAAFAVQGAVYGTPSLTPAG